MSVAGDAVRPHLVGSKQIVSREVCRKRACCGRGPQILRKVVVSAATVSVKCIRRKLRGIESP
jgi:hypothetical protein